MLKFYTRSLFRPTSNKSFCNYHPSILIFTFSYVFFSKKCTSSSFKKLLAVSYSFLLNAIIMPGIVKVKILEGRNLPVMDRSADTTDAYVELKLGSITYKSDVYRKSLNPQWNTEWYKFEVIIVWNLVQHKFSF